MLISSIAKQFIQTLVVNASENIKMGNNAHCLQMERK